MRNGTPSAPASAHATLTLSSLDPLTISVIDPGAPSIAEATLRKHSAIRGASFWQKTPTCQVTFYEQKFFGPFFQKRTACLPFA
jgi:hypothetical protein